MLPPVAADVTDPAALSAAVAQIESTLGPLTLGVNAAGIANRGLHQAHYNSAKAAVVRLGRSLAWEWAA